MRVNRRMLLGTAAAAVIALSGAVPAALAQDRSAVRIGYVVSQTGVNAAGAGTTTIPNYELWVHDVNAAGGLKLPDGSRLPIEVTTYDDRSQTEEVVRGIERLANQDKVDFILAPWGTGFNLAVAPLMARFGYPQLAATSVVPPIPDIYKRWPTAFWMLGTADGYGDSLAGVLKPQVEAGALNGKVAMISIADGFGIELSEAARHAFKDTGFDLVMDKTYPLGTQDFSTLLAEAQASGADIFVAYSYPGDTFAITKQAQLSSYNPPVFHTGVGTNFPAYPQINDGNIEGVISLGGINAQSPAIQDYIARHKAVLDKSPDAWASPVIYASLEMLAQAIERKGLDREAVTAELSNGTFETILGTITLTDNQLHDMWYIGQWQGDQFVAVAPVDKPGAAAAVVPKPAWK
ncbi:amino acid ABC transporter substrate-binding protein [Ruixingdingia sedimenti]|uniref:Amino acid ABC transporter substrate-binding protein n=1 Tax=Ruixingdingia sedimenti TaxID=3073604 RepID=A0ABU1F663_9RHOB|nr:amino acid ABC transporter substrate-binding protein [Xinfangfangia sp. LG-4]MDR5652365.1 amino acid ABC transporter substrate-binding protein [Xinfangfangia sp. LG-4]